MQVRGITIATQIPNPTIFWMLRVNLILAKIKEDMFAFFVVIIYFI